MQNQENFNTKSRESKIAMSRNKIRLWIKEIWLSGKGWNTNIEFLFWRSFAPESQSASKVIFSICQYQLSKIRWCWLFIWWWSTWLWWPWWCLWVIMINPLNVFLSKTDLWISYRRYTAGTGGPLGSLWSTGKHVK